jgi:tight adherence protein C
MTALLVGAGVLCCFGAAWELAGVLEGRLAPTLGRALAAISGGRASSLAQAATRLRLPERIVRAGLERRLDPTTVIAAKAACAGLGGLVAIAVAPVVPARLAVAVSGLLLVAGFFAPDALLERAARRRRARFVAALPDALDMLAVGAASGRSPATVFGEIAGGTSGPLAVELGAVVAEIECGRPTREAIEDLRTRVAGAEVGGLAAALERSRAYGSPLAEQLHLQATTIRGDARRRVEERASRAAPKIQLVVALVLVPSVLLMIVAAIVAHSEALFGQLQGP